MTDLLALFLAFLYAAFLLLTAEMLHRRFNFSVDFTRKFVHIGAGMAVFGFVIFFETWQAALVPPLAFIALNYVSYRIGIIGARTNQSLSGSEGTDKHGFSVCGFRVRLRPIFRAFYGIETGERGHLGTVYFPLAFAILIPLLWQQPARLVAAMMPLTWGDSFAAILGKRFGAHRYAVWGQTRSVEGSLAMFVFSVVTTFAALTLFGQPIGLGLARAFVVATVATIAEAIAPYGTDNLAVPLLSAATLALMSR